MTLKMGIIADDFTGATDIASFMTKGGWKVIQLVDRPQSDIALEDDIDAVVISLKIRSCPVDEAINEAIESAKWLLEKGALKIFFKYCSTFDSTPKGNIGPVTDALMQLLKERLSVFCPALPVNGRTVVHGHLFVNGMLLNESGMQHHPINPMTDANLMRLLDAQSRFPSRLIDYKTISQGSDAIKTQLNEYARLETPVNVIFDTLDMPSMDVIAKATEDLKLITGGSGLGGAYANIDTDKKTYTHSFLRPKKRKTVIVSGSCSEMTNKQVAHYKGLCQSSLKLDIKRIIDDKDYMDEVLAWVLDQPQIWAPMVYATSPKDVLTEIQKTFGVEASSQAIEKFFAELTRKLKLHDFKNFIIAGGETSGAVTQALDVKGFYIGESIAPGVPWVADIGSDLCLTLKSGNFGSVNFFEEAQIYEQ